MNIPFAVAKVQRKAIKMSLKHYSIIKAGVRKGNVVEQQVEEPLGKGQKTDCSTHLVCGQMMRNLDVRFRAEAAAARSRAHTLRVRKSPILCSTDNHLAGDVSRRDPVVVSNGL